MTTRIKVGPDQDLTATGLTATDLFCGAGGSAIGLQNAGIDLSIAANHWKLAVETHQANFPLTDHDVADISQVDPRRYPATDILWASPECTNHSQAKGVSKKLMRDVMVAQGLPMEAAERSRATMWDVPRFCEAMEMRGRPYRAVIVENVVDAVAWGPKGNGALFRAWLMAMESLGYDHKLVFLNSQFAGGGRFQGILPAPQSRDRLYIVFWLHGQIAPDLDIRPHAFCPTCENEVASVQTFKRPDFESRVNRYRSQYTYNCPSCKTVIEPYTRGAWEAIDWELRGQRIGDREKPLADATMKRIEAGLRKFSGQPLLVPTGGTWNNDAYLTSQPFRTILTRDCEGLIVPVERGHDPNKKARGVYEPLPTQTSRATQGVAFVPFLASIRGGGSKNKVDPVTDPMATVSAGGNHHLLVMPNGFVMRNNNSSSESSDGSEMCTPFHEPFRTLTTKGHQSIVMVPSAMVMPYNRTGRARPVTEPMHTLCSVDTESLVSITDKIDDVEFRMLQPHEQGAGMAFPGQYVVLGNKREQTRQYGNAVTPPASELLATAVVEALRATEERAA